MTMDSITKLIFSLQFFKVCYGLLCYTCENEPNNFLCVGEYNLRPCDTGFDTCQTIVSYSGASESLSIIKTCTKNSSCQLQIKEHTQDVPCDKTGNSWICTSCCNDDACNLNSAPRGLLKGLDYNLYILLLTLILTDVIK